MPPAALAAADGPSATVRRRPVYTVRPSVLHFVQLMTPCIFYGVVIDHRRRGGLTSNAENLSQLNNSTMTDALTDRAAEPLCQRSENRRQAQIDLSNYSYFMMPHGS